MKVIVTPSSSILSMLLSFHEFFDPLFGRSFDVCHKIKANGECYLFWMSHAIPR